MRIEYKGVSVLEGERYRVYRVHQQGEPVKEIGIGLQSSVKLSELLAGVAQ